MKIQVRNQNEWEGEARGVWFAFRDLYYEWGNGVIDYIHSAVQSLGITRQEVEYIWTLCEEMDKNSFFRVFEDSYPLYIEHLEKEYGDA